MLQAGGEAVISKRLGMARGKSHYAAVFMESAVTVIDQEGVIVESSGPVKEFFALGERELAEKNWFELFVAEQEVAGLSPTVRSWGGNWKSTW